MAEGNTSKKTFRIPIGPDEILRRSVELLDEFWERSDYVLGGGTALAARWNHRHSTDIDLFIETSAYSNVFDKRREEIRARLEQLRGNGEIDKFSCGADASTVEFRRGMQMSLVAVPPLTDTAIVEEFEKETGVRLESTAEILAKKVFVRMNWRGDMPARDLYDLIVGKYVEPEAVESAMRTIDPEERLRIARIIENDISTHSLDQRQIERPKYRRIVKRLWSLGVELFSDKELTLRNPLEIDDLGH